MNPLAIIGIALASLLGVVGYVFMGAYSHGRILRHHKGDYAGKERVDRNDVPVCPIAKRSASEQCDCTTAAEVAYMAWPVVWVVLGARSFAHWFFVPILRSGNRLGRGTEPSPADEAVEVAMKELERELGERPPEPREFDALGRISRTTRGDRSSRLRGRGTQPNRSTHKRPRRRASACPPRPPIPVRDVHDDLAERNAEGRLTPEEYSQLSSLVRANLMLSVLKAEARAFLQHPSAA